MKNAKQLRCEREWLETLLDNGDFDTFATLTFKTEIGQNAASKALHMFWQKMDKGYFRGATRQGKKIQRICVLHKGGTQGSRFSNIHFHFLAKCPSKDLTEFKRAINFVWKHSYFDTGYINDVQVIRKGKASRERLRDYLLHEFDKRDEHGQLQGLEDVPVFDLVVYDSEEEYAEMTNDYSVEFKKGWLKTKRRAKKRNTHTLKSIKRTPKHGVVKTYTKEEIEAFNRALQVA